MYSSPTTARIPLIFFIIIAALLLCCISPSFYFRDGSEFIVVAAYSDIAHPAGYPLYAELAHLFTLIPFASLSARVNIFSLCCALIVLSGSYAIIALQALSASDKSSWQRKILLIISLLPLLASPAFVRQSVTAEVYMLMGALFIVLLTLYHLFHITNDTRYILLSAFIAGLGLGNHVALVGPIVIALITLCIWHRTHLFRIALPATLFFTLGFSIYAHLITQSSMSIPLRTGEPTTIARFYHLITDARDRALKNSTSSTEQTLSMPFITSIAAIRNDLTALSLEVTVPCALLALIGLVALWRTARSLAFLLTGCFISSIMFFSGWQPDPWIIPMIIIALCFARGVLLCTSINAQYRTLCCALLALYTPFALQNSAIMGSALRALRLPEELAEETLLKAPPQSIYLTESTWFPHAALQYTNNLRPDITLAYQPRILFPYYFEQFSLLLPATKTTIFNSKLPVEDEESSEPQWSSLGEFMQQVSSHGPLCIEPNIVINSYLGSVVQLRENSCIQIRKGQRALLDERYREDRRNYYARHQESIRNLPRALRQDAVHTLEQLITNETHLLALQGHGALALELYQALCDHRLEVICSPYSAQNRAKLLQYMIDTSVAKNTLKKLH
jgi:hypothetical protein